MAKYRKTQNLSDSLELLLDTMCNTFGGIMFIAISLVVLSSFISGGEREIEKVQDSRAIMQMKITAKDQKIKAIQSQIDIMKNMSDGMGNSPTKVLIQNVSEFEKRSLKQRTTMEVAEQKISNLNKQIALLNKNNREKENYISKSQLERSKLNFELSQLKQQAIELEKRKKNTQDIRKISFNTIKMTSRIPSWMILSGNVLYQIDNKDDVHTEPLSDGGVRYTPNAGHGLAIGNTVNAKLKNIIFSIQRNNQFMSLFVLPDSFSAMTTIKKYIQAQGLRSNWYPVLSFHECVLYPMNANSTFESE